VQGEVAVIGLTDDVEARIICEARAKRVTE
jgi:hypothetical protein